MPTINKDDMTITVVCQSGDEASARADLQELLEANPGYKPVLTVEDAAGNEVTHTDLSSRRQSRSEATVAEEEPTEETAEEEPAEEVVEETATEEEAIEETTDEESIDEESTDEETVEEEG